MPSTPSRAVSRWHLISILLLGAGLLASACGDGGTSAPAAPPAPPPAPPPPPEPPPTPDGVGITSYGPDFVEWNWNPVEGADGYEVQVSAGAAATEDGETVTRTAEQTSYRGEGLESETAHYFRVRSFTGAMENRLASEWSEPAMAQIGRFVVLPDPEWEATVNANLSDYPESHATRIRRFLDYATTRASADRGLPGGDVLYTFGCSTAELQGNQTEDWLNDSATFSAATVDMFYAETTGALISAISRAREALDGMLDRLAASRREGSCGLFRADDAFVWDGEEDEVAITLQPADGSTGEPDEWSVIRVLSTPLTLDPAAANEAGRWWVLKDETSLGEPEAPSP